MWSKRREIVSSPHSALGRLPRSPLSCTIPWPSPRCKPPVLFSLWTGLPSLVGPPGGGISAQRNDAISKTLRPRTGLQRNCETRRQNLRLRLSLPSPVSWAPWVIWILCNGHCAFRRFHVDECDEETWLVALKQKMTLDNATNAHAYAVTCMKICRRGSTVVRLAQILRDVVFEVLNLDHQRGSLASGIIASFSCCTHPKQAQPGMEVSVCPAHDGTHPYCGHKLEFG